MTRIISKKIIAKYFNTILYISFLLNLEVNITSSSIFSILTTFKMRIIVAIAPIGIITEFVRKSKKSSISNSKSLSKISH